MGDKDETWRLKIRLQQSPILLFGALCRGGLQKEFDMCKATSCEKCRPFHFYVVRSKRRSESEVCESKNPWGQNDQVINRRSFGYGNRERV